MNFKDYWSEMVYTGLMLLAVYFFLKARGFFR